jgi:hypothetical protein
MASIIHQSYCLKVDSGRRLLVLRSDGRIYEEPFYYSKPTLVLSKIEKVRLGCWSITIHGQSESGKAIFVVYYPTLGVGRWGDAFRKVGIPAENEAAFVRDSICGYMCAYPWLFLIAPVCACSFLGWIAVAIEQGHHEGKPWLTRILAGSVFCVLLWGLGFLLSLKSIFQVRCENFRQRAKDLPTTVPKN